jgi:Fe-S-cluster-containing hydrogenase component 2
VEENHVKDYEETGVLTPEQLKLPARKRFERGPVAIIECLQKIPCDPCGYVCKFGAIEKRSIVDPPEIDYDRCTGCGKCVPECPGLAIFVVNLNYKEDEATITMPYELLPVPKKGEVYQALDREGKAVGEARIVAVRMERDRTLAVTVAVKKPFAMTVRNIGKRLR